MKKNHFLPLPVLCGAEADIDKQIEGHIFLRLVLEMAISLMTSEVLAHYANQVLYLYAILFATVQENFSFEKNAKSSGVSRY